MSIENDETAKIYQATVMLLCGRPRQPVDVLFLHNRSFGDYTNLFEIIGEIFHSGRTRFIAVTNNEGERFSSTVRFEANPGKTECIRILEEEQQIPPGKIIIPQTEAFHTRQENDAFLELSRQERWITGIILTQPHQLLRATLGMVQSMDVARYQMAIYTATPDFTPWQEVVKGNQGTDWKPRIGHIAEELERVRRYQAAGALATFEELFDYLKAREEGSLILGPMERGSNRLIGDLPLNYQSGLI